MTNFFSMALRHMQVSPQTGMSGYIHIPQFISYTKPLGKYCNLRFFFIFCDSAAVAVVVVVVVVVVGIVYPFSWMDMKALYEDAQDELHVCSTGKVCASDPK